MAEGRIELPQGTLDLLILKTMPLESMHGCAISVRLQQISREALQFRQGSLYAALHRLERHSVENRRVGWLKHKVNA